MPRRRGGAANTARGIRAGARIMRRALVHQAHEVLYGVVKVKLWPGGPEYEGGGAFPVTTDSVLLADFARVRPGMRVLELGCGAGIISLLLLTREPGARLSAVEIDARAAGRARANLAANGHEALVVCGDLRDASCLPEANSCALVVCNPPYFPERSGKRSADLRRAMARSEGACTFADVCAAAARSLKQGGRFAFVHRAERLPEIFALLAERRLEPKRLRLVQHSAESAPSLALCEAVRLGAPGLSAEPTLVLHNPDGSDSAEARRIYHMED